MTCTRCNSSRLEPGNLFGGGAHASFKPDKPKFLSSSLPSVKVSALMCAECGAVTLRGDVAALEKRAE